MSAAGGPSDPSNPDAHMAGRSAVRVEPFGDSRIEPDADGDHGDPVHTLGGTSPVPRTAVRIATTPTPPVPPPVVPPTPATPISRYPYSHSSTVLPVITAARAGKMGSEFYGRPEIFGTWTQRATLERSVKETFLPMLGRMISEANAFTSVGLTAADLDQAVTNLNDPDTKNQTVLQVLEDTNPALVQLASSEFMQSQFGTGYITPLKAHLSSAYESGSNPITRLNDFGLTDVKRQKTIAMLETALLFAGTEFEHKDDGSFTLSAEVNGKKTPILVGTIDDTSYKIKTAPGIPASERARALLAMATITRQFSQANNSNSRKINAGSNANVLEIILHANELICHGRMHIENMSALTPRVMKEIDDGNFPNKDELKQIWNKLVVFSTMRSHRNPDVIVQWPHSLIKDFSVQDMLAPRQAIDAKLSELGEQVTTYCTQPAALTSGAQPPALPPIPPPAGGGRRPRSST